MGDEETIKAHLKENGRDESDIEIVHAADSISMDEDPLAAVRHKRDSSMVVAAKLVREKKAQAAVTSGSTGGALVAAGPLVVGRLKGASRPALATPIPTVGGHPCVILDIGANPECQAKNLLEFAIMGSAYASALLGIDNPSIGLLSNGTEASKGTSVIVQANQMLSGSGLNFVGNIEARSIFYGEADVVVMDGFAGNVVLKLSEGLGSAIFDMVKEEMSKGCMVKAGALLVKPALKSVKRRMDYSEYGGALLSWACPVCLSRLMEAPIARRLPTLSESLPNCLIEDLLRRCPSLFRPWLTARLETGRNGIGYGLEMKVIAL